LFWQCVLDDGYLSNLTDLSHQTRKDIFVLLTQTTEKIIIICLQVG
jgi:hypothetical protein